VLYRGSAGERREAGTRHQLGDVEVRGLVQDVYGRATLGPEARQRLTRTIQQAIALGRNRGRIWLQAAGVVALLGVGLALLVWAGGGLRPVSDSGEGEETPGVISGLPQGTPALHLGSVEEAERAVGFTAAVPGMLPDGAVFETAAWNAGTAGSRPLLTVSYLVAGRYLAVTKFPAEGDGSAVSGDKAAPDVAIHGLPTEVTVVSPEAGDDVSRTRVTLRWVEGGWCYIVDGELPLEEMVRVAESVPAGTD